VFTIPAFRKIMNKKNYDIIIIGAGPAGLCAALHTAAAAKSASILLVDQQQPGKEPIACAEGVGRMGFHEALTPREVWIRCVVTKAAFHSPDNTILTYTDPNGGYIINRSRMQKDLVEMCREQGVECRFNLTVRHVSSPDAAGLRDVVFKDGSAIRSHVVIDCSGPLSRIGREESLPWKPLDLEPAYFAHVGGIKNETDTAHIFMSQEMAPGGYGWAFPRDATSMNVGILVGSRIRSSVNVRSLLDAFIRRHFGDGKVLGRFAGTIPCFAKRQPIAIGGLIKAGDAASTVNPISRGGITEAMLQGRLAGTTAMAMLGAATHREMSRICKDYEKAWYEKRGKRHLKLARVKEEFARIGDADFNTAACALAKIPQKSLTMAKIFRISLGRFPRMVWAMRHLM
jgi:digeranylgeranylglycerophospholipid reductase